MKQNILASLSRNRLICLISYICEVQKTVWYFSGAATGTFQPIGDRNFLALTGAPEIDVLTPMRIVKWISTKINILPKGEVKRIPRAAFTL